LRLDAGHTEAHEMWQPVLQVAIRDQPFIDTAQDPIGQLPLRQRLRLHVDRCNCGAETCDRGDVLVARASRTLLIAANEQRPQPNSATYEQRAHARRTSHLVGGHRQQVAPQRLEIDRHVHGGLCRVDVNEDTA
jgi:hypothetical protein